MVPEVFGCADLLDGVLLRGNNLGSNLGKNVMHRKKLYLHYRLDKNQWTRE